ncbi:MAG: undecaprenyl-diphosphate phosphatase [Chitinophagales bacterium]|nr:undecaprenyl-diphosphate phosphatase [Chitinophagales bacterium]
MTSLEAIIIGIIQGLTEFLPVSSSGHLELGRALLGENIEESLTFTVIVHFATVLSTLVVFRKDIVYILRQLFKFENNQEARFSLYILVSMIPVAIVGFGFKDQVESLFSGNILLVGIMLMVTGTLLLLTIIIKSNEKNLSVRSAILIGIAQAIAVIPGISRSGSTISTGLLLGIRKDIITRFSFLMVIPPIIGGTMLEVKELMEQGGVQSEEITSLSLGFLGAFIAGLAACQWMIKIVRNGKIQYFAYYCFFIGIIAIIASCY